MLYVNPLYILHVISFNRSSARNYITLFSKRDRCWKWTEHFPFVQLLFIIKSMEKRIEEDIPILGRVYVNFVDLASRFFEVYLKEQEVERQRKTAHLGLISKAFKGINHSRFDYLILQCVISELADNNFKGTTSAQGNIKLNGKKYFGNDIIKSWCLFSNFGH